MWRKFSDFIGDNGRDDGGDGGGKIADFIGDNGGDDGGDGGGKIADFIGDNDGDDVVGKTMELEKGTMESERTI